jgi:hypothetical protein
MPEYMKIKFHYLVRGILFADGKILLAHQTGAGNTFLPGESEKKRLSKVSSGRSSMGGQKTTSIIMRSTWFLKSLCPASIRVSRRNHWRVISSSSGPNRQI